MQDQLLALLREALAVAGGTNNLLQTPKMPLNLRRGMLTRFRSGLLKSLEIVDELDAEFEKEMKR